MRVLLVDDHRAVRGSVRNLIDDQPTMRVVADMRVVAEARSAEEARSQLEPPVDVGIVDYHLGPRPPRTGSRHSSNTSSRVPTCSVLGVRGQRVGRCRSSSLELTGLLGKGELGQELCRAIRGLAPWQHHLPAIGSSIAQVMGARLEPRNQAMFGMRLPKECPEGDRRTIGGSPFDELRARRSILLDSIRPTGQRLHLGPDRRLP